MNAQRTTFLYQSSSHLNTLNDEFPARLSFFHILLSILSLSFSLRFRVVWTLGLLLIQPSGTATAPPVHLYLVGFLIVLGDADCIRPSVLSSSQRRPPCQPDCFGEVLRVAISPLLLPATRERLYISCLRH